MKKFRFLALAVCILFLGQANAHHIIGGAITYIYKGGNTYTITMKIYRDCNSQTLFDGQPGFTPTYASFGVFELSSGSYTLVSTEKISNPVVSAVNPNNLSNCFTVPSDYCVEQGVYTFDITVPDATKSYTVSYQRCCRNGTISNLNNPGNFGTTYSVTIPPTNQFHNSSPLFKNFPPTIICVNSPLSFDHSATDVDGDSLVYKLCTPFDGGDQTNPVVDPPTAPPYTPIVFNPPYSVNDPLGGIPLHIDSSTGLLTAIPNQTGQYVVGICVEEYRNGQFIGSYLRDFQFNVIQCSNPVAQFQFQPGTIDIYEQRCSNKTVTFDKINYYDPYPSGPAMLYHWDFGVNGISSDTSNIKNPTYTYPDTGTFIVKVIITKQLANGSICKDSTLAKVIIYPVLITDFIGNSTCIDSAIAFKDNTLNTFGILSGWKWTFGDGSTSILQNPIHGYASTGTYTVTLTTTTSKGCIQTISKQLTVFPQPVASFTTSPVCLGQSTVLTSTSTNNITQDFWQLPGGVNLTGHAPTYIFTTPGVKTVTLISTNNTGCRDTISKQLTVFPLPIINKSPDKTICHYTTTVLVASGGTQYAWSPGATLNDSTISTPTASPISNTKYLVTVTDGNGCKNMDSIKISLFPIPPVSAGLDTSVCLNPGSFRDQVTLQATGALNYVWTPATGLNNTTISNPTSHPSVNTTYFVTGTDANGCKASDSVIVYVLDPSLDLILEKVKPICIYDSTKLTVLVQGADGYLWTPNIGISSITANSPAFFPQATTTYVLQVSNYCYTKKDTVTILVHPLPVLSTEKIDSVCIHDSVQIHVQGASTYHWKYSTTLSDSSISNPYAFPSATTTYFVTGTDTFGCKNKDSVKVLVFFPPITKVLPDTPYICLGQSIQLNAMGGVKYSWNPDPTLTPLNIATPMATPTDTTTYYVTITNIHNCSAKDSVKINVQLPVKATTKSPFDVCEGTTIQLSADGGFYYLWTPSTWLNNPHIKNPLTTPKTSINYLVKVSNDCFFDTITVEVIIRPIPTVEAGLDTSIYRNTPAILSGTTNTSEYYWSPSTYIKNALELTTEAYPLQTTMYRLYAISEYGCHNYDSVLVTVIPKTLILLPSGFSPNGDGENDVFRILKHLNIEKLAEFSVFNRWGERIWTTTSIAEGWNGTYKGEPQEIGTYIWALKAYTYDGETFNQKGNITLIR